MSQKKRIYLLSWKYISEKVEPFLECSLHLVPQDEIGQKRPEKLDVSLPSVSTRGCDAPIAPEVEDEPRPFVYTEEFEVPLVGQDFFSSHEESPSAFNLTDTLCNFLHLVDNVNITQRRRKK